MDQQFSAPPLSLPQISPDSSGQPQPVMAQVADQPLPSVAINQASTSISPEPLQPAQPTTPTSNEINAPSIADDVDLIEKEWIHKIKEIVQHTKGDPYECARQLTLLKNEYMQKRYNKTIKLT